MQKTSKAKAVVVWDLGIDPGALSSWVKKERIERGEEEGLGLISGMVLSTSSVRMLSYGWCVTSSSDPWS